MISWSFHGPNPPPGFRLGHHQPSALRSLGARRARAQPTQRQRRAPRQRGARGSQPRELGAGGELRQGKQQRGPATRRGAWKVDGWWKCWFFWAKLSWEKWNEIAKFWWSDSTRWGLLVMTCFEHIFPCFFSRCLMTDLSLHVPPPPFFPCRRIRGVTQKIHRSPVRGRVAPSLLVNHHFVP